MEAHEIRNKVCDILGVSVSDLLSKTRKRQIVEARVIVSYILYKEWDNLISFEAIGELLSRDHSSITHYLNVVAHVPEVNLKIKKTINLLNKATDINGNNYVHDLLKSRYGSKSIFNARDMREFGNECLIKL